VPRLSKIRELLARPENIQEAHETLAQRVGQLTLEGVNENGKKTYLAHGKVDSFGEEDLCIPMVPGEGNGPNVCVIQFECWAAW
jgi:hypothetical protein